MMNRDLFVQLVNEFQDAVHENARNKGFHDAIGLQPFDEWLPNKLAEIIDEVVEARRAHRNFEPVTEVAEELVDVIIRALDCLALIKQPVGRILIEKHERNLERGYKHGRLY